MISQATLLQLAKKAAETRTNEDIEALLSLILSGPGASRRPDQAIIDKIYALYPRKIGRRAAESAIAGAIKRGHDPEMLVRKVTVYARAKSGCDTQFIPHPSTWFNQDRFLDDEKEWFVNGNGSRSGGKGHIGCAPARDEEFNWDAERATERDVDGDPDVISF